MSQGPDPRETWRKLQQTLSNAQQQGRKGLGGNPRNLFGGAGLLLVLGGGALVVNNALFNGTSAPGDSETLVADTLGSRRWSPSNQVHKNRRCSTANLQ